MRPLQRCFWWLVSLVVCLVQGVLLAQGVLAQAPCPPTPPDALGPMYIAQAPVRAQTGQGLVIAGTVRTATTCAALRDAQLEWWSANPQGKYDDAHRATQRVGPNGDYRYETDVPGLYPGRPVHIHVRVTAPGHRALVTQLYPQAGQTALTVDLVLQPQ